MLFGLFDRDARRALLTPGPWIAVAVALLVLSPHLIWLFQNDFLPLAYAEARASTFKKALDYLTKPSRFALAQLLFLLPSLIIAAAYLRRDVRVPRAIRAIPARCVRPPHRHAAGVCTGGHDRAAFDWDRAGHYRSLGLSALAVSGPLDRTERATARTHHPLADCFSMGCFFCRNGGVVRVRPWRVAALQADISAILYPGDRLGTEYRVDFGTWLAGRWLMWWPRCGRAATSRIIHPNIRAC